MKLLFLPFKALWYAFVIALPLLGFWLGSSLAVFLNGPRWLPWLAGGLSLLLPLIWEVVSQLRFSRKMAKNASENKPAPKRIMTVGDRVMLRTLALNLLFVAVLIGAFPQKSFAALATRGDWMLEGRKAPWADKARQTLFQAADGLEGLYEATRNNPYARWANADGQTDPEQDQGQDQGQEPGQDPQQDMEPSPVPGDLEHDPVPSGDSFEDPAPENGSDGNVEQQSPEPSQEPAAPESPDATPEPVATAIKPAPAKAGQSAGPPWPLANSLHPAIQKLPKAAEADIASVAAYIGQQEKDPYLRVKAIYDYLASHISYDAQALFSGEIPPQDAETVFSKRTGVCAGYANLFKALADQLRIPAAFVVGDSRTLAGDVAGSSHAWNAVQIGGKWYLLDATWGAGYVENLKFTRRYTSAYLLTPPEIFSIDHLPEEDKWQLRKPLLDRGEFARQPLLRASFFERGWQLVEPRRSQISVADSVSLKLKNAHQQYLMARLVPEGGGTASPCQISGMANVSVSCAVPAPGSYQVMLFANTRPSGSFEYIGQLSVISG